jgi:hypothetical protein
MSTPLQTCILLESPSKSTCTVSSYNSSAQLQEQSFQNSLVMAIKIKKSLDILINIFTYIIWLSQILLPMGELTVLRKRAFGLLKIMLAELSFIFLLESVELTLVSVEIVVVGLLSEMPHHFSWWIIKVARSALGVIAFTFVSSFLVGAIF